MYHHLDTIIQLAGLGVSIVGLIYLIKYVRATKGIEDAAVEQSRAANEQAKASQALVKAADEQRENLCLPIIMAVGIDVNRNVTLRNLGNGPAIKVEGNVDGAPCKYPCRTSNQIRRSQCLSVPKLVASREPELLHVITKIVGALSIAQ
ncbi:MAG TPA: hypothetical protein VGY31_03875 [Terriglobia bacterium]|nr:hypothetical protein [Terriglobia bacterium]